MKNFKRFILTGLLICCGVLFTSCLDSVQTIDFSEDGFSYYFKMTVPKAIFEMEGEDPNSFVEDIENDLSIPYNAQVNEINNDSEVGVEYYIDINLNTDDEEERALLPWLSEDESEMNIPFILGFHASEVFGDMSSYDEETQGMMYIAFSSTKARVMVSKDLVPYMSGAYFAGYDDYLDIPFYDYGNNYCIEVPLIYLAQYENFDVTTIIIY